MEKIAIREAIKALEANHYKIIENVERNKRNERKDLYGFDLLAQDENGHEIKIEVKGSTKGGIPDAFQTEFEIQEFKPGRDKNIKPTFRPDYLAVVSLKEDRTLDKVVMIKKEEIDAFKDKHTVVAGVKFARDLIKKVYKGEIGKVISGSSDNVR